MNKKHVNTIIYTAVFGIAYGGFLYHHSSKHAVTASSPTVQEDITAATESRSNNISTMSDNDDGLAYNKAEVSEKTASFKAMKKEVRKKIRWQERKAIHISSPAVYSYTAQSADNQQGNYFQQAQYNRPAMAFTSTTVSSTGENYAQNNFSTQSYSSALKTNLSGASTSNSNGTKTSEPVAQSPQQSDGSEFLPDGSSQQDLFSSRSKNPRVYTIKSYQTADINCAPGYDDASSPHATLMRGLKGC